MLKNSRLRLRDLNSALRASCLKIQLTTCTLKASCLYILNLGWRTPSLAPQASADWFPNSRHSSRSVA